jgi:hypothetical protein
MAARNIGVQYTSVYIPISGVYEENDSVPRNSSTAHCVLLFCQVQYRNNDGNCSCFPFDILKGFVLEKMFNMTYI